MKKCVISFATADRNYRSGLASIQDGLCAADFDGDFLRFTDYPPGCPSHQQAPYGFKAFIIEAAISAGYSHVLYLDSSAVILRGLQPIFHLIEAQGYFLHRNDDVIGEWCKDEVLQSFGVDRTALMQSICHLGGIMGVRADSDKARRFLAEFKRRALDGYSLTWAGFDNDKHWAASRTDARQRGHRQQAVTSLIAYQLGMVPFSEELVSDAYLWERPVDWTRIPRNAIIWFDRIPVHGTHAIGTAPSDMVSRSKMVAFANRHRSLDQLISPAWMRRLFSTFLNRS